MIRKILLLFALLVFLTACAPAPETNPVSTVSPQPTPQVEPVSLTSFALTAPDLPADGRLPVEYTCDGDGSTLALAWSGAPAGTQSYVVIMHHNAPDGIHWYWVLYDIPADVTGLPKNVSGVGVLGNNLNNGLTEYSPPCSKGPGDKEYIYTIYALSAEPQITVSADKVDRDTLLTAIQDITLASAELTVVYAREGLTDPSNPQSNNPQGNPQDGRNQPQEGTSAYNIEQATSDKAQGMTISYDALAFMTGDLGSDSFFPPGKVADFWGFQYLRDNDPSQMGHAGDFLTSAAMNTLNNLTADQRAGLVSLATSQVDDINEYGYRRFVLMDAFRRLAEGHLPAGTTSLDQEAVKAYSTELYQLDGQISFERAQLMGNIINSLRAEQTAYFDAMVGKGMLEWNDVQEPEDIRGLDRDVKVAVMTYAADLYSWYAGSVEADVYFCPERHGTYFGSFYLKDIKAMSDPTYAIPTNLTGDLGEVMLSKLTSEQAQLVTSLVDVQKPSLQGIVSTREQVSRELRKFKDGGTADRAAVMNLMAQYGAYDGEIIYNMAINFAAVKNSLTTEQQAELDALRAELLGDQSHPTGAYLYSQAISMPEIPNSDFLFK